MERRRTWGLRLAPRLFVRVESPSHSIHQLDTIDRLLQDGLNAGVFSIKAVLRRHSIYTHHVEVLRQLLLANGVAPLPVAPNLAARIIANLDFMDFKQASSIPISASAMP